MLRDSREFGSALLIISLASCAPLAGCSAPHKLISARHTSCPVRKVEIHDLVTQPQREDWIAICGEQRYACATRERGRRLVYGCRPLAAAGTPDAGVAAPDASAVAPVSTIFSAPDSGVADAQTP